MPDDNKGPSSQTVDGKQPSLSIQGTDSLPTLTTQVGSNEVNSYEESFSADVGSTAREAEGDELPPELQEGSNGASSAEDGSGTESNSNEDTAETSAEPLPEFDAANEEVLAAYDARYMKDGDDGYKVVNFDAFNAELAANFKDGKTDLDPGSRAWVKATIGVSDEMIDQHLEGLVSKAQANDAKVYAQVGGPEVFESLHAYAKEHYSEAQKAAYNAAAEKAKKGDFSDLNEQLDLLSLRAQKAGFKGLPARAQATRIRRPSSPVKSAGSNTNGASRTSQPAGDASIFKSSEEHRIAQNEALASKDNAKIAAVRAKLARSMQSKDWQG
jgi:hypothetical protein